MNEMTRAMLETPEQQEKERQDAMDDQPIELPEVIEALRTFIDLMDPIYAGSLGMDESAKLRPNGHLIMLRRILERLHEDAKKQPWMRVELAEVLRRPLPET